jgi:GntR family transcriptional repressor for pyruvate dehydrogenase complex
MITSKGSPKSPPTTTSYVMDAIRDGILEGRYPLDSRLDQQAIADELGVSLVPVREGLRLLEAEGFVKVYPRRGVYVRGADPDLVSRSLQTYLQLLNTNDITWRLAEIRRILEIHIAPLAAARATAEQRAQLRKLCQEMRTSPISTEKLAELDLRFHMLLAEATQNELFGVLLAPLMEQMADLFHNTWADYGTRPIEIVLQHHEAVLAAVEQGNPDAARRAMIEHMDYFFLVLEETPEKNSQK